MNEKEELNLNKSLNLILGITGSVASIKLKELVEGLFKKFNHINICVLPTKNSINFIPNFEQEFNSQLPDLKQRLNFLKDSNQNSKKESILFSFSDEDEWSSWCKRNDPVLHIELRKWADLMIIAPLDANTLGKISNGLCDNLLTSVLRAWDIENINYKPVIVCPAMNTCMYKHPITRKQLDLLVDQFGFILVDSVEKTLMCGDVGIGAMAKVEDIINFIYKVIKQKF